MLDKSVLKKLFNLTNNCVFIPYKIKIKIKIKMQKKGFVFIDGMKIFDSNFGIKVVCLWCKDKRLFLEVIDEKNKSVFYSYR